MIRGDPRLRELAEAFCRQAGNDLVPMCREILAECRSEDAAVLVALFLGHSRRPEAIDVLAELAGRRRDGELFDYSVYSIGRIKSPRAASFLLKLYSDRPDEQGSILNTFGTSLMAAVGLCGRDGALALRASALKELPPEFDPETLEWRRFAGSQLALADSPGAFEVLREIVEKDSDVRLRTMALAALGGSSDVEQRVYLAQSYFRHPDPRVQSHILNSLVDGIRTSPGEWLQMRERLRDSIGAILTEIPVPGDSPGHHALNLAAELGGSDASLYLDRCLAAAGDRQEGSAHWMELAVWGLARQGSSQERFEAFFARLSHLDAVQRVAVLEEYYFESAEAAAAPISHVLEMTDALKAAESKSSMPAILLGALSRMPAADGEVSRFLDAVIARGPDQRGDVRFAEACRRAPRAGAAALERSLRTGGDLSALLHVTRTYLDVLPDDSVPPTAVDERMRNLFSAESLRSFSEQLLSKQPHADALPKAVGSYFGRFGTLRDLDRLDAIQAALSEPKGLKHPILFHGPLREACLRAADAIRLRSN